MRMHHAGSGLLHFNVPLLSDALHADGVMTAEGILHANSVLTCHIFCRGNADMLLLLLSDDNNEIIGEGLRMIARAQRDCEVREPSSAG
jgi:hypothetical protein